MPVSGVSRVARTLLSSTKTYYSFAPNAMHLGRCRFTKWRSSSTTDTSSVDMDAFLTQFKNHEKSGVPVGAGVASDLNKRFDLEVMHRLLKKLDNPHRGYPVIHVAGTKGKGSTVSLLSSILRSSGLTVGTYKSPHVRSVSERIVCGPLRLGDDTNGGDDAEERKPNLVSPNGLDTTTAEVLAKFASQPENENLSYFECLTALAFLNFKKHKVDVAVVEVGVGGVTDATNVIHEKHLAAAVLTALGDDHLDALGGSLGSVAAAKAGIVKHERPVFLSNQPSLEHEALLLSNIYKRGGRLVDDYDVTVGVTLKKVEWSGDEYENNKNTSAVAQVVDFEIHSVGVDDDGVGVLESRTIKNVKMNVLGPHQRENARQAVRVVEFLKNKSEEYDNASYNCFANVTDEHLRFGLETAQAPGCFEVLMKNISVTVIADGAHTADSANALFKTLNETVDVGIDSSKKLAVVIAMASDKNHVGFMEQISKAYPDIVVFTETLVSGGGARATDAQTLRRAWDQVSHEGNKNIKSIQLLVEPELERALDEAMAFVNGNGVVCVTGSLNVVGRAETWANGRKG